MMQAPYIHTPDTTFKDIAPPAISSPDDTVVGTYYNILFPPSNIPEPIRKAAITYTLRAIQQYADGALHFFALQEVTADMLGYLKETFGTMQWVTQEHSSVTVGLSPTWKIREVT